MDETRRYDTDESRHPLVVEVRRRGSDACNVRDAAHEAHHALSSGTTNWEREAIHRTLMRRFPDWPSRINEEILARAVEQLVCKDLAMPCWSVEKAAHVMFMEHVHNYKLQLPDHMDRYIKRAMRTKTGRDAADRVLALIGAPSEKPHLDKTKRYGAAELQSVLAAPKGVVGRAKGKNGTRLQRRR
jgi:hypothetical protein